MSGLPNESRTKRKITGQKFSLQEELLMHILDSILALSFASRGKKSPVSIYDEYHKEDKNSEEVFETEECFEEAWAKATRKK